MVIHELGPITDISQIISAEIACREVRRNLALLAPFEPFNMLEPTMTFFMTQAVAYKKRYHIQSDSGTDHPPRYYKTIESWAGNGANYQRVVYVEPHKRMEIRYYAPNGITSTLLIDADHLRQFIDVPIKYLNQYPGNDFKVAAQRYLDGQNVEYKHILTRTLIITPNEIVAKAVTDASPDDPVENGSWHSAIDFAIA